MRVVIHKKNLEITSALAKYLELKLIRPVERRLKKISVSDLPLLEIEIGRSTRHHQKGKVYHVEANLTLGGTLLRAEVDDDDARKSCDLLKDGLLREIVKYKNKRFDVCKKAARKSKQTSWENPTNQLTN